MTTNEPRSEHGGGDADPGRTMRITLVAVGTRGDVQPTAVLASALAGRGHDVTLVTPDDLVHFGRSLGIATVGLGFSTRSFLDSPEGRAFVSSGSGRRYLEAVVAKKELERRTLQAVLLHACDGADLVIANNLVLDEAAMVAQVVGAEVLALHFAPRRSSAAYPSLLLTARPLPRLLVRATHIAAGILEARVTRAHNARFRQDLGLPHDDVPIRWRLRAGGVTEIQAYSAALVPGLRDWPDRWPRTGFLAPSPEHRDRWCDTGLDEDLDAWLRVGEAPVYFGFGSMPVRDPVALIASIRAVCQQLGVRGVVGAGWSGMPQDVADDRVRLVGAVDHTALLARCRAAVHHGGAGTTGVSVAAGIPTVICAVAFDQPFWGERVREAGVGTWFPFAHFSVDRLVAALRAVLTETTAARARALAASLADEDPVAAAVTVVEQVGADAAASAARRQGTRHGAGR